MGSHAAGTWSGDEVVSHSSSDVFFRDMHLIFRRESDGWLHQFRQYDVHRDRFQSGNMLVKLTDARDDEIRKEHQLSSDFSDQGTGVDLLFLDMLKHARQIEIRRPKLHIEILNIADPHMKIFEPFERLLEIDDDPVPALESLTISLGVPGYFPRDYTEMRSLYDLRSICGPMKSRKFMKLTRLEISMVGLRDEGLRCLVDVIKAGCLPSLAQLALSKNWFGSHGFKYVARYWGSFPSLSSLDLSDNFVGDCGHLTLAENMRCGNLPVLERLRFGFNQIGNGGHLALSKAMESRHLLALVTLDLCRTGMEYAGCQAYAYKNMCVGNLPALKILELQGNQIGDAGAAALGVAIQSGKISTLTYIDLYDNTIGDKGVIDLAKSFKFNIPVVDLAKSRSFKFKTPVTSLQLPRLEVLKLGENEYTEKGLLFLSSVLMAGHLNSLRSLQLNPRIFSESCAKAMVAALAANNVLDCEINYDWHAFPAQDLLRQQHQERNRTNAQILEELGPVIPAVFGKVYLCGNPGVGKTTLRNSLQRTYLQSLGAWESRQREVNCTRGIEVSELISVGKQGESSIELALWDMAGQDEYHVVHNAFFPDLASASGKATTFVVVCNPQDVSVAQQELKYWLQFIASSCGESVLHPRKVLFVLNCFGGDTKPLENSNQWEHWLEQQSHKFKDYLNIEKKPFIVDVRKRKFVKHLKRCLIDHSRGMLETEKVPKVSSFIQSNLKVWREEGKQFPVFSWEEFVKKVKEKDPEQSEKTLETAAKYLNEAGVLLYIEQKEFQFGWDETSMKKIVVLDPNWFCKEVVGNMFLPYPMGSSGKHVFRLEVDKYDGSIPITKLQEFFMPLHGEWNINHIEDLVAILVWLGLCYEGRDRKVFIPALIELSGTNEDNWRQSTLDSSEHRECQWVMGYSVEHEENTISLAPMALWHRFQVELAKCPQFNGHVRSDNDFSVGKYDIVFTVNYMNVLISVDASKNRPTFHGINIFVKPFWPTVRDCVDSNTRKECQVDLASSLVEILLRLWNHVCPGVEYVHRVIWPWPASHSRKIIPQQNMKVKEVLDFVEKNGLGILMQWRVGNDPITREQLLSKREFNYAVQSIKGNANLGILRESMREAVELGIFPLEVVKDQDEAQEVWIGRHNEIRFRSCEAGCKAPTTAEYTGEVHGGLPISEITQEVIAGVNNFLKRELVQRLEQLKIGQGVLHDAMMKNLKETKEVRYELAKVTTAQRDVLRKLEEVGKFLLEDKERSFPRFVYVGQKNSDEWVALKKLKEAVSPMEKVHLHFLCEAEYDNHGQHRVVDQEGLDVYHLTDWAQKLLPWLKVSLTVLLISAKVAANAVAPGLGLIIPDLATWQQTSLISDGIALATGYSKRELDALTKESIQSGLMNAPKSSHELRGPIRKAMTEFLGNLTPSQYERKLGLQKVRLLCEDGSFHGVVWICKECHMKYGNLAMDIG